MPLNFERFLGLVLFSAIVFADLCFALPVFVMITTLRVVPEPLPVLAGALGVLLVWGLHFSGWVDFGDW